MQYKLLTINVKGAWRLKQEYNLIISNDCNCYNGENVIRLFRIVLLKRTLPFESLWKTAFDRLNRQCSVKAISEVLPKAVKIFLSAEIYFETLVPNRLKPKKFCLNISFHSFSNSKWLTVSGKPITYHGGKSTRICREIWNWKWEFSPC